MTKNIKKLADQIKTPAYVFFKEDFVKRAEDTRAALGDGIGMCYSIKANPFLVDPFFEADKLFDLFEVCSPGELRICQRCGVTAGKILFSGVNKNTEEIKTAMSGGVRYFTAESMTQFSNIHSAAQDEGITADVLIRIADDSQFGMDKEEAMSLISSREDYPHVYIRGIHYFTGTQKKTSKTIVKETGFLKEFCEKVSSECGFAIEHVEYGTGLDAACFKDQTYGVTDIEEIVPCLKELSEVTDLTIEMGRFFASDCGYYFTKVVDVKKNAGTGYLIVDGGMNQLHYDGQIKGMKSPHILHISKDDCIYESSSGSPYTVCGSICSTEDVICAEVPFDDPAKGDILVFMNCGAYSVTEGMALFLSREMPQIQAYSEKDGPVLLRDTIETDRFNCRM